MDCKMLIQFADDLLRRRMLSVDEGDGDDDGDDDDDVVVVIEEVEYHGIIMNLWMLDERVVEKGVGAVVEDLLEQDNIDLEIL